MFAVLQHFFNDIRNCFFNINFRFSQTNIFLKSFSSVFNVTSFQLETASVSCQLLNFLFRMIHVVCRIDRQYVRSLGLDKNSYQV